MAQDSWKTTRKFLRRIKKASETKNSTEERLNLEINIKIPYFHLPEGNVAVTKRSTNDF